MAFTTLVALELVRVQVVRSQYHLKFLSNPWIVFALISSLALQLLVLYVPSLATIFGTVPLSAADWGIISLAFLFVWGIGTLLNKAFR